MDPQQTNLLEVVFETLENAGLTLKAAAGSRTGCYVGNFITDHQIQHLRDLESLHRYIATGVGLTILASRISHVFDLRGPSMVVDTACSSSLHALNLACSALTNGEVERAIVAAANIIQSVDVSMAISRAGMTSGTSTCHTFDASADGYARAEAVNAIYVKRLEDAIEAGDSIRAVIRGSAVNSNGSTIKNITLPSGSAQQDVIRRAYAYANLPLDETHYVELHGTSTPVGDPIEVEAVAQTIQVGDATCYLSSRVSLTNLVA